MVRRQRHTRNALHMWAWVATPSPVQVPCAQLSSPQTLGLPAPLGRRKQSVLGLQIHEPLPQKYTLSAMRWEDTPEIMNSSSSAGTDLNHIYPKTPQTASHQGSLFRQAGAQADNICPSALSRRQENKQKPLEESTASADCKPKPMLCGEGLT